MSPPTFTVSRPAFPPVHNPLSAMDQPISERLSGRWDRQCPTRWFKFAQNGSFSIQNNRGLVQVRNRYAAASWIGRSCTRNQVDGAPGERLFETCQLTCRPLFQFLRHPATTHRGVVIRRDINMGGKATRRRTDFPYYKAQEYVEVKLAWMDARKEAFKDLAEARAFLVANVAPKRHRIIVVEANGRRILETTG